MPVLLGVCFAIVSCPSLAGAQPLPPPPTFNDLPPSSDNQPVTAPEPAPPAAPNAPASNRAIEFNGPSEQPSTPSSGSTRYRVYVSGDSSQLLEQVRKIDSTAFVRRGEGIIQAGLYVDESKAQLRVAELGAQGITAQISPLSTGLSTAAPNSASSDSASSDSASSDSASSDSASSIPSGSYFAVIPGSRADLANVAIQVIQLGISQEYVRIKESPRGPHVAVGPFEKRGEADSWSSYLRSRGMDARVYYGR